MLISLGYTANAAGIISTFTAVWRKLSETVISLEVLSQKVGSVLTIQAVGQPEYQPNKLRQNLERGVPRFFLHLAVVMVG